MAQPDIYLFNSRMDLHIDGVGEEPSRRGVPYVEVVYKLAHFRRCQGRVLPIAGGCGDVNWLPIVWQRPRGVRIERGGKTGRGVATLAVEVQIFVQESNIPLLG